ncbi:sulfurtransferase [Roseomonas eburnea]|uniref:Sulfurtransferase n=1 Tax=Neoroseomonas eburnea TaxID=1346889 RepID=A0A9X9XHH9_9PROT|nr:rhodanese-like domain-containing protein [Neoroseomonas eburnea]MBR0683165.1 sulfurtransferase [Neoroseomonas eburnea]
MTLTVTPAGLAAELGTPGLVVLDGSVFQRPAPDLSTMLQASARPAFAQARIPGSVHLDALDWLWDRARPYRFALPSPEVAAAAFAAHGVGEDSRVVLYDRVGGNWAARTFWTLRWLGFDAVRVLEGGFAAWQGAGLPVEAGPPAPPRPAARPLAPRPRTAAIADRADVLAALGDPAVLVVNALSSEQHAGTGGLSYHRPGRIAGSRNLPATRLADATLPPAGIAALAAEAGIAPGHRVIAYCGGGIAASNLAFNLLRAGWAELAVYDGSLDEWGRDPSLPMETGAG